MTLLMLFGFLLAEGTHFKAEDLGLYQPEKSSVWAWGEDLLFWEYTPAKLVLVSSEGKLKARFEKEGPGPDELFRPTLMGFDDQFLYMINNRTRIVVFDKNLKMVEKTLPPLQPVVGSNIIWQGVKTDESSFILVYGSTGIQHKYGMIHVTHDGKKWTVKDRYFPFDIQENNKNLPMPNAKNPKWQIGGSQLYRIQATVLQSEDQYEILIYSKPWLGSSKSEQIGGMFSVVEDITSSDSNFRCFPDVIGKIPSGYVVQLSFDRTNIAHDYFDERGGFLKRDFEEYHILPVGNADFSLKVHWENEDEIITILR